MASTIRTSNIENQSGNAGIFLNPTSKGIEIVANGFNLAFTGVNIVPQNKLRVAFTFNANDQTWTVPGNVTNIYVKLWGSGGGGGSVGGWTFGSWGGGGGHTRGIVPVTPGEELVIRVPRGGFANPGATNAPFGGGSSTGGGDNQYAAGGGGYCGLFRTATPSPLPLLIAGAGGGGGSVNGGNSGMCNGGPGGGLTGLRGDAARNYVLMAGGGGTQTAGGAGGNGGNNSGNAGTSLQGGSVNGNVYGGGGGGGYYGGGSGSYGDSNTMAGGGGGSGFIDSSVILGATFIGVGRYPANMDDIDYPASTASTYHSVGFGGVQATHGGDGYLVIYY